MAAKKTARELCAAMAGALHPALIVNPEASRLDLLLWAENEVANLRGWVYLMACSALDVEIDHHEFAGLVLERLDQVLPCISAACAGGEVAA